MTRITFLKFRSLSLHVLLYSPLCSQRRNFVPDRVRSLPARSASVKDDWCAWLPEEKFTLFNAYQQQLEAAYAMLSVSLNEALELRQEGRPAKASQIVCVVPALCTRLTNPLVGLLRGLAEHAKHYGLVPNAAPLDPANFRGPRGQWSARMSGLLGRVLLSQRSHYLQKISTLHEMVEDLGKEIREDAQEILEGASTHVEGKWQAMEANHFDLNTCFREAIVLLKSFLLVLPDNQLVAFQDTVVNQTGGSVRTAPSRSRVLRHRRIPQIAGE
jgi:hypothetical protein